MQTGACLVFLLLAALPVAGAQSTTADRVVKMSAVHARPAGDASVVAPVSGGEGLEVLGEHEACYLLHPPESGTGRDSGTDWVDREPPAPSGSGTPDHAATATQPQRSDDEPSADRKGFIIGIGAGPGIHRTPGFSAGDFRIDGTNNFGIVTDFKIGYAPTDQILLYYSNLAAFTSDTSFDVLGISGLGTTYMLNRTSPTAFVDVAIGVGVGSSIGSSNSESGLGFSLGGGYEFSRHWSVDGDAIFIRLGDSDNQTVFKASFSYLFY